MIYQVRARRSGQTYSFGNQLQAREYATLIDGDVIEPTAANESGGSQSRLWRVKTSGKYAPVQTFSNEDAALRYARTHGGYFVDEYGTALATNEDAGKGSSRPIAESDSCPIPSPGLATLLGLPAQAAVNWPDAVRIAWRANGKKSAPRNAQAIGTALVGYFATERGCSRDEAEKLVRDYCPLLFKGELAKTAGTSSPNDLLAGNEAAMLDIGPTVRFA